MARDARSLPDPGIRGHVATNTDLACGAGVSRVPTTLPDGGASGPRIRRRRAASMGRPGLQPPRREFATRGSVGRPRARRGCPTRARTAPDASGDRVVYGQRGRMLRVRRADTSRGYQRATRAISSSARRGCLCSRCGRCESHGVGVVARRTRVRVEPGAHGYRCNRVSRSEAAMRRVPRRGRLRLQAPATPSDGGTSRAPRATIPGLTTPDPRRRGACTARSSWESDDDHTLDEGSARRFARAAWIGARRSRGVEHRCAGRIAARSRASASLERERALACSEEILQQAFAAPRRFLRGQP